RHTPAVLSPFAYTTLFRSARLGVKVHTSHTILSANGEEAVTSVTIARVDEDFRPIPGSERSFACDTVLVAVGLDPVDDFTVKARDRKSTRLNSSHVKNSYA